MAMRNALALCARLAEGTKGSVSATIGRSTPQTTAGAAVAAWYGRRHFASEGEGASLRQSADHHLQGAGSEESPGPDSTAINQKSPMSSDGEGNPQVGKVSTPDGDDDSSSKVSTPDDVEADDVVPNLEMPKDIGGQPS